MKENLRVCSSFPRSTTACTWSHVSTHVCRPGTRTSTVSLSQHGVWLLCEKVGCRHLVFTQWIFFLITIWHWHHHSIYLLIFSFSCSSPPVKFSFQLHNPSLCHHYYAQKNRNAVLWNVQRLRHSAQTHAELRIHPHLNTVSSLFLSFPNQFGQRDTERLTDLERLSGMSFRWIIHFYWWLGVDPDYSAFGYIHHVLISFFFSASFLA